jgi:hypothetical protein
MVIVATTSWRGGQGTNEGAKAGRKAIRGTRPIYRNVVAGVMGASILLQI